jgi:putative DNA primase/helicase
MKSPSEIGASRLLERLQGVKQTGAGRWIAKCPAHGDRTPSLSIRDADGTTLIFCHAGCNAESVLAAVDLSWVDLGGRSRAASPSRHMWRRQTVASENDVTSLEAQEKKKRCDRLWGECVTLDDPRAAPVQHYLSARIHPSIISRLDRAVVRCHPMLDHYDPDTGRASAWPAMVALVQAPNGENVGLHRTWIDGDAKAPVTIPRKTLSAGRSMLGGAIRLMKAAPVLGLAEGVETALALNHLRGFPVWSCISAMLLTHVELPALVREVRIGVDVDISQTGRNAAHALGDRLRRSRRVILEWPTQSREFIYGHKAPSQSFDWCDLIKVVPR